MTPTEEAAKLAKQISEKLHPNITAMFEYNQEKFDRETRLNRDRVEMTLLPILTASFAERDEELKRLREAAGLIYGNLRDARDSGEFTTRGFLGIVFEDLPKLLGALQPKEPNNES